MIKYVYLISFFIIIGSLTSYSQDLVVTEYKGRTSFDQYQEFNEVATIKNDGIIDIASTGQKVNGAYLSTDPILDYLDPMVGFVELASLNAGQSVDLAFDVYECDVPPGTYYLILKLDYYNQVVETDETNNIFVVSGITVKNANVDWKFSSLTLDAPSFPMAPLLHPGETIGPVFQIKNSGTTNTGGVVFTSFYVSSNNTFDAGDSYIGRTRSWLDGVDVISEWHWFDSFSPVIPPSVTPGQYYIIGVVDPNNDFTETNESNNTFATGPVTIAASDIDLTISQASLSGTYYSNVATASYKVTNNGTTGAGGYAIMAYLSEDNTLSFDDFSLRQQGDTHEAPYVQGNNYSSGSMYRIATFPQPDPGAYYLILVVNAGRYLTETDYTNNTTVSYFPIIFIPPPPSPAISITSAAITGLYDNTDTELSLTISFTNSGDPILDHINYRLTFKDTGGNIVFTTQKLQFLALGNGGSQSDSWAITLNNPLPYGNYTLEITSSSAMSVTPLFNVPLRIDVTTYAINTTIQGEDGIPITHGKLFLYQKGDDGIVKFINKAVLTASNNFTFYADGHEHTLYFIPDRAHYPDYVPTILGKTVTLKPSCFLRADHTIDTVLDVLKIQPLPAGTMSISGNVNTEATAGGNSAGARVARLTGEPLADSPVILLSSMGKPVAITTTDSNGFYEFTGLPGGTYQLVVALELDKPALQEPLAIDVTTADAVVNFTIGASAIDQEILHAQEITFSPLITHTYLDASFTVNATTSSSLPLVLSSSDLSVAKIENGKIVITGVGKTMITASQFGNASYLAARPVSQELIIDKASQSISFNELPAKTFGDVDVDIQVTASSGLTVSLQSSNPSVAILVNGKIKVRNAGVTTITAIQGGDANFKSATLVKRTLIVHKKPQTLAVADLSAKTFGDPSFSLDISPGSKRTVTIRSSRPEIVAVLNGMITIRQAGQVTIFVKLDGDNNYEEIEVGKPLTINKADQEIRFNELSEKMTSDKQFSLTAVASSSLPVTYHSDNEAVATITQLNIVTIKGPGVANISATQVGSGNFNPAMPLVRQLRVTESPEKEEGEEGENGGDNGNIILGTEITMEALMVFPNPVRDVLTIKALSPIKSIELIDPFGKIRNDVVWDQDQHTADMHNLASGVYFLKVALLNGSRVLRVVKR